MRILFITSKAFIPEHFSGQNRSLYELCRKLTELGHEPVILSGKSTALGQSDVIIDREYGFRLFRSLNPLKSLAALSVTLRPDIAVIVDGHFEALIAECSSLDIPLAVWFFYVDPYSYQLEAPNPDLLYLASSSFLVQRISALFGIKAEIIPPYIEQNNYDNTRQGNRVLFFNPTRGHGVELAFQLAEQRPDLLFTFVESWGLPTKWKGLCFERALRCGNIEWILPTNDINPIFEQTKVLLVPRFNEEGFCRLVTEAQLSGIPVLSSDRGYLPENVGSGGTVLEVDADIAVWLEQLDRFFDDQTYYHQMSKQAQAHGLRAELNGDRVVESLLMLLTTRIAEHRSERVTRHRT